MPVEWTARFEREMKRLPADIQERTDRIILLLDESRNHPSLRLKKLKRLPDHWEIRVTSDWRIILLIQGDLFTLLSIGRHDVLNTFKSN